MPTILKVSLWQIGLPWQVDERRIDDTMLWAVYSGRFVCRTDDGEFQLEPGNLLFVPAGRLRNLHSTLSQFQQVLPPLISLNRIMTVGSFTG